MSSGKLVRALLVGMVVVVALVACGSAKKRRVVHRPPPTPTVAPAPAPAATTNAAPASTVNTEPTSTTPTPGPPASLGTPVQVAGETIVGQPPDAQLEVTALKVKRIPKREFSFAPPGGTYGVVLKIKNTGTQAFTDDLSSDVQLLTDSGQTGPGPALLAPNRGFCATNVNVSSLNLPPAATITVCVPATPPQGAKPTLVRFTPDGGLSMDYAEWRLR